MYFLYFLFINSIINSYSKKKDNSKSPSPFTPSPIKQAKVTADMIFRLKG